MLSRLLLAHSVNPVGSVASSAMPASETQKQRTVLLTVVFWIGVGLAPLAAALVLLSSGATGLRVAAGLGGGVARHPEPGRAPPGSPMGDRKAARWAPVWGAPGRVPAGPPPPAEPAAAPAGRRAAAEPVEERGPERDRRTDWAPPREESWTEQRPRERRAAQQREGPPRARDARGARDGPADSPDE